MPNNRVAADNWDGGGVDDEIVESCDSVPGRVGPLGKRSATRKSARFADSVAAPRRGSTDGDDNDNSYVEVSFDDWRNNVAIVDPAARGEEDSDATPQQKRPSSSSYGHGVLGNASTRIKQASKELRRLVAFNRPSRIAIDRSNSSATRAIGRLKFIARTADGPNGRAAAATCFDKEARDGLLHRSKFAKCIGMKELAFASELFDALARRRSIFGDSINKAQLLDFWDQISDTSFDSRLQTFFDMVDKNADGRISEDEIEEIITMSASANTLTMVKEQCHEYARLIMEELDPYNVGYIEVYNLEMLLLQIPGDSMRIPTNKSGELSDALSQVLQPTAEPDRFRRWHRRAAYFLEENWRRCWVMLLWVSICAGLFSWKFMEYRRAVTFQVMGYCVCVAKGGVEMIKFNMALILLPVCRNTITWLRSRTGAGRFVPFDDSLGFHKVVAAGVAVGVGFHAIAHLTCNFPRLLHASSDKYEPMKPFFGEVRPPNYWWFVKGIEGSTGVVMLLLMAVSFTLAMSWFRRGKLRVSKRKQLPASANTSRNRLDRLVDASLNRFTGIVNAMLNRFTGFNAFWYTHHLFVVLYALLLVHAHFLYLTNKWQKKTTWMYLAVPMAIYACERLARTLWSRVRTVKKLKVAVHPDPASILSLQFSKPKGFRYRSGQYIFIKCAAVSPFQWHPFSITSAPDDDYVSVHIKTLGDWTKELKNVFLKHCPPSAEGKSEIRQTEYDCDTNPSFPKVLIDGPYGAPAQDYKQYDVVLLVGLGIGATPMISIIKDIINNMKRLDGDIESGDPGGAAGASPSASAFRTRQAYFYWVTREQGSFEWFRAVLDEVAAADKKGVIELHNHCSSVYEEGDARSALIAMLQSLNFAKNGVDVVAGTRVKTHFGRPDWRKVYERIALTHVGQRVGVFYCGEPVLTEKLRNLAMDFSTETDTKFEFHSENF